MTERRLTARQREALTEIWETDVQVDRMRSERKDGTTSETWTWLKPPPRTDRSAREIKRLHLLEKRGLIGMRPIERWANFGAWTTIFDVRITDTGVDALLPVLH